MSNKRSAEVQITKDGPLSEVEEEAEESDGNGRWKPADPSVIAQRRIVKAKFVSSIAIAEATTQNANPFAAISLIAPAQQQSLQATFLAPVVAPSSSALSTSLSQPTSLIIDTSKNQI